MFTSEQLQQFKKGPKTTYVPPTVPVRARRPEDPSELPASERALAVREQYWDEVEAIVANYKRCVEHFGRQDRAWWIEGFWKLQVSSGRESDDFLKGIGDDKN